MNSARSCNGLRWAGVATSTLALVLCRPSPLHAQESPAHSFGRLEIAPDPSPLGAGVVRFVATAVEWVSGDPASAWSRCSSVARADNHGGIVWRIDVDDAGGLTVSPEHGDAAPAQSVFEASLDVNEFRRVSPGPFSRTARGRALDALSLDNARRARLACVAASPEEDAPLSLVVFYESRAEAPGRWHAQPLATVALAPVRGEAPPQHPLEVDFGEQWGPLAFAMTDLALGLDPDSATISTEERFSAWGVERLGRLRGLLSGAEAKAWVWVGEDGPVVGVPLVRASAERVVADQLRSVFGLRLAWTRDEAGRATGTVGLTRENRRPVEGDRTLSIRLIRIADRTVLTMAAGPGDLDAAPAILAKLAH